MRQLMNGLRVLVAAIFMTGLFAVATPQVQAANCQQSIRNAERNLQMQERRHGRGSPQARRARQHLEDVRERCREHRHRHRHR